MMKKLIVPISLQFLTIKTQNTNSLKLFDKILPSLIDKSLSLTIFTIYNQKSKKMAIVTLHGTEFNTSGSLPKVGEKAPDFNLTTVDLKTKTRDDYNQDARFTIHSPNGQDFTSILMKIH